MANLFSVLLPYFDDLWWFCTQLIYGIVYIIDFIYKLLTALFNGFVQLWGLSVYIGNAFVFSIKFLPEWSVRSFHAANYLHELVLKFDAAQACRSWFWATLANGLEILTAIFKNLGLAFFSVWTQLFDLLVFYCVSFLKAIVDSFVRVFEDLIEIVCSSISSIANGLYYIIINTLKEIPTNYVTVIDYFGQTVGAVFESAAEGYSYIKDIQLYDLLVFHCVSFLKALVDSFVRVFEDLIEIVCSSISSIANDLYYIIINTLKEIPTFLITVIDYLGQTVGAVFESAAEGYSSISSFIIKNWGALLALALFITLVWVFINMRNIQNILKDLTQIVNSFTHYRPHEIDRELVRPEGHLQHDIHPQGQQQVELQDRNEENENTGAGQDLPVGLVGEGDQPGPSRPIHTLHSPYLLRSRPFTPSGEPSGENNSEERTISDLENRLIEEEQKQQCVVCQDAVKDTAFVPCRHLCVCLPCADKIMSSEKILSRNCPLCRARIGAIFQVYS